MGEDSRRSAPILFAVTIAVVLFTIVPMLVSITAGLVNNYSTGLASGLTTRWLTQVWGLYGPTAWHSIVLAASCVVATLIVGVPCAYALAPERIARRPRL